MIENIFNSTSNFPVAIKSLVYSKAQVLSEIQATLFNGIPLKTNKHKPTKNKLPIYKSQFRKYTSPSHPKREKWEQNLERWNQSNSKTHQDKYKILYLYLWYLSFQAQRALMDLLLQFHSVHWLSFFWASSFHIWSSIGRCPTALATQSS